MKSKTTFLFIILSIIIALGLTSCMNNNDDPIPDPYLSLEGLKVGFFRNGKILFSVENPELSMFSTTDAIGIRMLKETNDEYQEVFSCLDFISISQNAITFKNVFYTSEASKTISLHTLTNGQTLDLNGDESWDIRLSATNTAFSESRKLADVVFIELNNTPDKSTTFRTIPGNEEKNYPIMTINNANKICIDEKALSGFNNYDPGERTIDIDTGALDIEITKDDFLLLGPSYKSTMGCPIKKIENIEGTGSIRTLHLVELDESEYSQFFRGTKYKDIFGTNPDEPYLIGNRATEGYVLWSGKIDHKSQSENSTIRVYSHEPIQIILSFMDIDFEMGLDDDLIRFFYHPIFAIRGNITMEVNASHREISKNYFFSEPVAFDRLSIPLSGHVRFGFSNQSDGEGRIDSHVTYQFDDTYYSLRVDAQDWDEPTQWVPYADFRRDIKIVSATGTMNTCDCSLTPSLHLDSTLSLLNLFHSQQNDLRFGLKFNNFEQSGNYHLDVIPSFELTTEYTVEYLEQERYHFPAKPVYSVELSPYSIY
ncbi:MAG: hypothetical protein U9N62_12260 [Thermotogota bacterium]|nr:hypothetical protein [Thermotogota bacterium]